MKKDCKDLSFEKYLQAKTSLPKSYKKKLKSMVQNFECDPLDMTENATKYFIENFIKEIE